MIFYFYQDTEILIKNCICLFGIVGRLVVLQIEFG